MIVVIKLALINPMYMFICNSAQADICVVVYVCDADYVNGNDGSKI